MRKLYQNGTILTMESENDIVEAVLVENGKIIKTGKMDDFTKEIDTEIIDLKGKTMMPAFIDSHSHISMVAQMSSAADLSECTTFEQIIEVLKEHKKNRHIEADGFILGFGYDHNFLPGEKHPTKEYLNQVSTEIPIYISHTSGHMGCANDIAMELANVNADTPDPAGGVIGRIEGSKVPNGYFEEKGMTLLQSIIAPRVHFDVMAAMEMAQNLYFSYGITTAQDGASSRETVQMLKSVDAMGKLKIDVISYPLINESAAEIFKENKDCANQYLNHFKLGGYKAVLDGSPQGKSAWLTKPYENSGDYCAYSWFDNETVEAFMEEPLRDNQQILVHCNGDAAADQFIRCYKKAFQKSTNPNKKELRPVMIHCQTVRKDQLDEMVKLNMIPSIFVSHVYYWGDVHYKNLGAERAEHISPCASAFKRGLVVNIHQDTPVIKPDMLHSVWCAVNRITGSGKVLGSDERCSVYEALKAVTINAAYEYFEEDIKGTISVNKKANFVILDKNPLNISKSEIKDIKIVQTIKEGEIVYINEIG